MAILPTEETPTEEKRLSNDGSADIKGPDIEQQNIGMDVHKVPMRRSIAYLLSFLPHSRKYRTC